MVTSLKALFKRAKASLEQSMVKRDMFEFGELKQLMAHPVIAPLLQKLLFVTIKDGCVGAFCELSDLGDTVTVAIAHPYDLYKSGEWLAHQRYAFEHQLIQPFKQVFRELYLVNEDELTEKTLSRRYAGHQVQARKTVALLKSRGWTVDPEASHSTIEMRTVIVAELLSLLHIENVTVKERYAFIQGDLGEYTVHLGSGVAHKMGKGAMNILAVQSQHRGRIFLPFADEDPRTAEVISKIILLSDDTKIKDPAILAQL